jgi:hypothetical protein
VTPKYPTILPITTDFLNTKTPSNPHHSGNQFVTGKTSSTDVDEEKETNKQMGLIHTKKDNNIQSYKQRFC